WNIFVRLAEPDRHMEAITSTLLLHAIATRIRHARQTALKIASSHAKAIPAAKALRAVIEFLRELAKSAEQLPLLQIWQGILARAFLLQVSECLPEQLLNRSRCFFTSTPKQPNNNNQASDQHSEPKRYRLSEP